MGGVRTGGGVLGWGVLGDGCREGDMGHGGSVAETIFQL